MDFRCSMLVNPRGKCRSSSGNTDRPYFRGFVPSLASYAGSVFRNILVYGRLEGMPNPQQIQKPPDHRDRIRVSPNSISWPAVIFVPFPQAVGQARLRPLGMPQCTMYVSRRKGLPTQPRLYSHNGNSKTSPGW